MHASPVLAAKACRPSEVQRARPQVRFQRLDAATAPATGFGGAFHHVSRAATGLSRGSNCSNMRWGNPPCGECRIKHMGAGQFYLLTIRDTRF
jgi:hypothetical protein